MSLNRFSGGRCFCVTHQLYFLTFKRCCCILNTSVPNKIMIKIISKFAFFCLLVGRKQTLVTLLHQILSFWVILLAPVCAASLLSVSVTENCRVGFHLEGTCGGKKQPCWNCFPRSAWGNISIRVKVSGLFLALFCPLWFFMFMWHK